MENGAIVIHDIWGDLAAKNRNFSLKYDRCSLLNIAGTDCSHHPFTPPFYVARIFILLFPILMAFPDLAYEWGEKLGRGEFKKLENMNLVSSLEERYY